MMKFVKTSFRSGVQLNTHRPLPLLGGHGARGKQPAVAARVATEMLQMVATSAGSSFREVACIIPKSVPQPGPGEVLVRVDFVGMNGGCETFRARAEHAFQKNADKKDYLLGAEGAGVVMGVGDGVDNLEAGQAVACNSVGFQEYAVVPEKLCAPVTKATPEAAALILSGVFACVAIDVAGRVQPGQNVLVTAGAGAAGSFAVQFAKLAGARVVTTVGSARKAELARTLGADVVLNHREVNIRDALAEACPQGFDVVMEGVGGDMFDAALANLAPGGRLLVSGYISEYPHAGGSVAAREGLPPLEDIFWKNMEVNLADNKCVTSRIWSADPSRVRACRDKTFELYEQSKIRAIIDPVPFSSLAQVPNAIDYMLTGNAIGKVVVAL